MKIAIGIFFFLGIMYISWDYINSRSYITHKAERQLQPILAAGTNKEVVMNYLSSIGHPAKDVPTHYPNGKCATASSGSFKWNCEYASYVYAGWNAGFLRVIEPDVEVHFVFNEKNELVRHYINVSYTFL